MWWMLDCLPGWNVSIFYRNSGNQLLAMGARASGCTSGWLACVAIQKTDHLIPVNRQKAANRYPVMG